MTVVGEAFVVIRPDDDDFIKQLNSINLAPVGKRMSQQLGDALDAVGADLRRQIEGELEGLDDLSPTLTVDADTTEAQNALQALDEQARPIEVPIDADADPLLADIRRIRDETEQALAGLENLSKVGDKFVGAGQKLTVGLTLPLVLLGRQAIGLASDVETTLAQTIGLAGGTAEQVDQANEVIRSLAGETGKSLDDLSDALLAIFSAGFTGADAFNVLDVSAHAAAAGLGTTRDVANAVTNAISAYGPSVLNAADATDILVNAVKEGKAEASELAPQFGRLLPVSSELGISFADVGAGLAFLTRSSGDASLSASQLAGVFNKLLKPSQQGADALLDAGFSAERIRRELQEKGLLGTLVDLRESVEATGGTFSDVFDDVEALNGALALTRDGGAAAAPVFEHLADSQGQLNSAFAAFDETKSADLAKASAQFSVALTDFGNVALPVLADVLGLFAEAADVFDHLAPPFQTAIVGAVGLAAALGPVLIIGGKLINVYSKVFTKLIDISGVQFSSNLAKNLGQVAGAAGILAAGAAIGGGLISSAIDKADSDAQGFLDDVISDVNGSLGSFDELSKRLTEIGDARNELAKDFNAAVNPFKRRSLNDAIVGLDSILASAGRLRIGASDLAAQLGITVDEALRLKVGGDEAIAAFRQQRIEVGVDLDPLAAANRALEQLTLNFLRGKAESSDFAEVSKLTNIPVEDLQDNLKKLGEDVSELADKFIEGLGGISDAFATTFGDDAKDTVDAFLDNFAKQTTDAATFTINLQKLIARGATGLAEAFATQGISAAPLVAEAAAASDKALADMETRFNFIEVQEGIIDDRQRQFAVRLKDGTLQLIDDLGAAGDDVGPRLAAALAQGDEAFFAELDAVAQEARDRASTGLTAAGEAAGAGLVVGLSTGMQAQLEKVLTAAQSVVDKTIGIFTKGFQISSPSKVMMGIGGDVAEGFNLGLSDGLIAPDLTAFTGALPSASTAATQALGLAPSFGASPAILGGQAGTSIEFSGDIIVPVPPGASPAEQAAAVGRQVAFTLQGSVG